MQRHPDCDAKRVFQKPDRAALMGLDDILWDKIAAHLPLRDYAALAATCRNAWKRPLAAAAELPLLGGGLTFARFSSEADKLALSQKHILAVQRTQFVSKRLHSGKLETLSCCSRLTVGSRTYHAFESETAPDIWTLAALSTKLPQLHTLAFKTPSTSMQLKLSPVEDGLLSVRQVQQLLQQHAEQIQTVRQKLEVLWQKLEGQGDQLPQDPQQLGQHVSLQMEQSPFSTLHSGQYLQQQLQQLQQHLQDQRMLRPLEHYLSPALRCALSRRLDPLPGVQHPQFPGGLGDPLVRSTLVQILHSQGALEPPPLVVQQLPPHLQQELVITYRRHQLILRLRRELGQREPESHLLQSDLELLRSPILPGRQDAILALLETIGCLAPQLSVLRMHGTVLQFAKLSLKFRALRHLTIDVWARYIDLQTLHGLTSLEVLRVNADRPSLAPLCNLNLAFLTGLKHFIYLGVAPRGLVLPESCECSLVSRGYLALLPPLQALIPFIISWLVTLEVSLPKAVLNGAVPDLLRLDVCLEQLTLECASMGAPESPLVLSLLGCPLVARAQQITLICWTAHLQIPALAELAWSRVRLIGQSQLWVSAEAPEVLLSGCAFLQFSFHVSNLMADVALVWRAAAEGLGLKVSICSQRSHAVLAADSSLSLGDNVATFYRQEEGVLACMQNSFCRCQACRSNLDLHGMLP